MALIPTFNNGETLANVRLNSLNPTIEKVNEINTVTTELLSRVGKSPETISSINTKKDTGWYYVEDANSGGRGKGLLQYFTISDSSGVQYIKQIHYPTGAPGTSSSREWTKTTNYWSTWVDTSESGFRMIPNPPTQHINYFSGTSEDNANSLRDAAMTASPDNFEKYKQDTMLLILLDYPDPTDASKKIVVYQNYFNGEWLEAFGHFISVMNLSKHTLNELKDGNRVATLERDVVTKVECTGEASDIDLCEGLIENNTLKLSKLRNSSSKYLTLNKDTVDHPVEFKIRPTWFGTFATLEEAKSSIPSSDLIDKETSFMVSGDDSHRGRVFYWDETQKDFISLHVEGSITANVQGRTVPLDMIKAGDNVSLSVESDGVVLINSTASSVEGGVQVKSLGQTKQIKTLNIPSSFGTYNDAAEEFIFPKITVNETDGKELGEINKLIAGENIVLTPQKAGEYVITSLSKQVQISTDSGASRTPLQTILLTDKFSNIDQSTGTLSMSRISATGLGQIKELKSGTGIEFAMGDGVNDGVLTIQSPPRESDISVSVNGSADVKLSKIDFSDSHNERTAISESGVLSLNAQKPVQVRVVGTEISPTVNSITVVHDTSTKSSVTSDGNLFIRIPSAGSGGGGTGTLSARTPNNPEGEYIDITKINVVGDEDDSHIIGDELFMKIETHIIKSDTLASLNTNHPAPANSHRIGLVASNGKFYWSDGVIWRYWGFSGMSDQVESNSARFPAQFTTGTYYSDEESKQLSYQHIPRDIAYKSIEDGGLGFDNPEDGILHSLYKEDTRWTQVYYGLETGKVWSRFYDLSDHWHPWKIVGGLDEGHYAVMTTFNDQTFNGYHAGKKSIPFQVVQDPSENLLMKEDSPSVMNKGVYDLTYCIHLSGKTDWVGAVGKFKLELKRGDGLVMSPELVGNVTADASGKFPSIIGTFKNVPMIVGQGAYLFVTVSGVDGIEQSILDPYKNFAVIEPSSSQTKTGIKVAKTFHNTLGGISFTDGYEVKALPSEDGSSNPRVFGATYNTTFSELTGA